MIIPDGDRIVLVDDHHFVLLVDDLRAIRFGLDNVFFVLSHLPFKQTRNRGTQPGEQATSLGSGRCRCLIIIRRLLRVP